MTNKKIFGIGFHKTGTTSLIRALKILGYNCKGTFGVSDPDIGRNVYQRAFNQVDKYDAFVGHPWTVIFKELDEKYPGSKFILTLRPTDKWIASVTRHFGMETTYMRSWVYGAGCPEGNEQIYISRYEKHCQDVIEYFKCRPDDLLVLRLTEGDGWDRLCLFLGKSVPDTDFPFENRVNEREERFRNKRNPLLRLYSKARSLILHK
jgi:hypothetical protein